MLDQLSTTVQRKAGSFSIIQAGVGLTQALDLPSPCLGILGLHHHTWLAVALRLCSSAVQEMNPESDTLRQVNTAPLRHVPTLLSLYPEAGITTLSGQASALLSPCLGLLESWDSTSDPLGLISPPHSL